MGFRRKRFRSFRLSHHRMSSSDRESMGNIGYYSMESNISFIQNPLPRPIVVNFSVKEILHKREHSAA